MPYVVSTQTKRLKNGLFSGRWWKRRGVQRRRLYTSNQLCWGMCAAQRSSWLMRRTHTCLHTSIHSQAALPQKRSRQELLSLVSWRINYKKVDRQLTTAGCPIITRIHKTGRGVMGEYLLLGLWAPQNELTNISLRDVYFYSPGIIVLWSPGKAHYRVCTTAYWLLWESQSDLQQR